MTTDSPPATDGRRESPLPLWQEATTRVRRLQRLQLTLLLVAGALIVLSVSIGGAIAFNQAEAQREDEARGESIRDLRADFVEELIDVRLNAPATDEPVDVQALLRFSTLAVRAIRLANSYEPTQPGERAARDAVVDIYAQFTNLRGSGGTRSFDEILNGPVGAQLATDSIRRFDTWANENSRTLTISRRAQDGLIARIAAVILGLVIVMSAVFVLVWMRIERARRVALSEAWALARRFDSLVRNASDIVVVIDGDGEITYCSQSAPRMLGWPESTLIGWRFEELVHPDDRASLAQVLVGGSSDDEAPETVSWRLSHRDGGWRDVETLAQDLLDDPAVAGIVLNSRDVTDRKAAETELAHLALHDSLTGLANRVLFEDRLTHALAADQRSHNGLAVLILDLDDFKTVNDGLGHHAGDELLRVVGGRIQDCIRPGDTAARLGGDEFGVLLETNSRPASTRAVAERIYEAIRAPVEIGGRKINIAASVGIALAPRHGDTPTTLIRYADLAMYAAKTRTGTRIMTFTTDMERALDERIRLRTDLAAAVAAGDQLVLEYQPIVDLRARTMVGLEALLRWDHPELGRIPPDRFIPLAEETGLILPIGTEVLRSASVQAAAWNKDAGAGALTVSVNLSARQLEDPSLIQTISDALEDNALPPELLTLEVTESVLMENIGDAITVLQEAKNLGTRVAIDDFGTGYSSLSQLGRLPVDIVKIDKAFVDRLSAGSDDTDLAGVIVQLGAVLRLQTVAEGIEDEYQLANLLGLHCDLGQGYLFARPMPPEDVTALLDAADGAVVVDPVAQEA